MLEPLSVCASAKVEITKIKEKTAKILVIIRLEFISYLHLRGFFVKQSIREGLLQWLCQKKFKSAKCAIEKGFKHFTQVSDKMSNKL
jgi:hypothetical protein